MIVYKTNMDAIPANCKECSCHWCRLPLKKSKYEPELKKEYESKRHKDCPLMETD